MDSDWIYEKPEDLICDAPDKPGAKQVSPLLTYPGLTEPTVKHSCKRCVMAAAIRATTNKVHFDPHTLKCWKRFFRRVIIPEFLAAIDKDGLNVSIEEWLKRYPEKYQDNMRREMLRPFWMDSVHYVYESFPKIELQFTAVVKWIKDTIFNQVKERQISGPPAAKKILANPFISALELLAHNNLKNYCGMKDWSGICKEIQEQAVRISDAIFGAADGSGFDMTQFKEMHEMVNELILECANHVNTRIEDPLSVEMLRHILEDALMLDVSFGRGAGKYTAEGRASGDGWTTFGNTVLMMSYWRFTFECAGITDYVLLVKGDDVLFAIARGQMDALMSVVDKLFAKKQEFVSHGLGQICKFIKFGELDEMDFLSNYFFYTEDGSVRMSRIPERVFQTMAWSTKVPEGLSPEKELELAKELCFSKGHSLLAWSRGLCIFEKYARKLIALGRKGKHTEFCQYSDGSRLWDSVDNRESYAAFLHDRYGLTSEGIKRIEDAIDRLEHVYDALEVPELSIFFSHLDES